MLRDNASVSAVEARLNDPTLGDSIVVVSSPQAGTGKTLVKCHIHTDQPQVVFDLLSANFSATDIPIKEKVEDMHRQVMIARTPPKYDPDSFKVTLITDDGGHVSCFDH